MSTTFVVIVVLHVTVLPLSVPPPPPEPMHWLSVRAVAAAGELTLMLLMMSTVQTVVLPPMLSEPLHWCTASMTSVLSAHLITVFDSASDLSQGPVAIGAPATPTPTGNSFIRVLQQPPDPNSAYGPFAYGLSSHSDVLTTFSGGDGEIGIHGNDDATALGQSVSHGCVRMDNGAITRLSALLPLGTPVDVVA